MSNEETSGYGLSASKERSEIAAPLVDYLPANPVNKDIPIALVGAGGITEYHLKNYKELGLNVVAIANRSIDKAKQRRDEFFPDAEVFQNYEDLLEEEHIQVVDVATHVDVRTDINLACLRKGKHVLSQKPLVLDIAQAELMAKVAAENNVLIAVNQNGRWAPHFSYMRNAIASGVIGEVASVDFSLQWDQTWIAGLPSFEAMNHLVLFDFAVHWFDILSSFFPESKAESVYAATRFARNQDYQPPALAAATIQFDSALATMSFNAHTKLGEKDVTTVVGSKGTLRSQGPGLNDQPVMELFLPEGETRVELEGCWFENGFQGTICELLCAIEQKREPCHGVQHVIPGLEMCFAAVESANTGKSVTPGSIRKIEQP